MELTSLSRTELLATLDSAWTAGNRALAKMLAYLGEVERRELHVDMSCSSMFVFVERRFGLTGGSAFRRLTAARLVRRFPTIMSRVENGDIHLELFALARTAAPHAVRVQPAADAAAPTPVACPSAPEAQRPRIQQLSAARHKVQLTVSSETRAKIERAQAFVRHRNPSGDLEVLFDRAMDALLEQLEKERLGKTSRPQKKQRPSKDGHIPAETRREVFERDGEQCTHVDEHGNRCGCRDFLELAHIIPRAKGGSDEASNLRVVCRAHNQRYAKQAFGEGYVEKRIEARRRRAGPQAAHAATSDSTMHRLRIETSLV